MWNEKLISCARTYPGGVLAVIEDSGYPRSVRCVVEFDDLHAEAGVLTLSPGQFLTGSGRQDTDRMPVAGSPLDIIRFMMLGRRKAHEYLVKRGKPWPPRPWRKMLRFFTLSHQEGIMLLGVSLPIVIFEVLAYACLGLCIWHALCQGPLRPARLIELVVQYDRHGGIVWLPVMIVVIGALVVVGRGFGA